MNPDIIFRNKNDNKQRPSAKYSERLNLNVAYEQKWQRTEVKTFLTSWVGSSEHHFSLLKMSSNEKLHC